MCFRIKISSLCVLKLPIVCVLKHSYTNFREGGRGGEEEREEDGEEQKKNIVLDLWSAGEKLTTKFLAIFSIIQLIL